MQGLIKIIKSSALLAFVMLFSGQQTIAQGSGFKSDFRLIEFDQARTACLADGAKLYEDHEGPVFGTTQGQGTYSAVAISLDQDWVSVQIGDKTYLVRPSQVSFGSC